ncbi:MAG: hypothetical protein ACI9UK_001250 [Candidatus Krumholzibacteriia bacterium]|jgi:hypothetical protein
MNIDFKRAVPAGFAATLALDLTGLLLTGKWWDIPHLLGAKLGTGLAGGLVMHYGIGVVLAIIFMAISPSLKGPLYVRALTYITVQTVLGVFLFMFPLLDLGVAGLKAGAMMPVISLARHFVYALVLSAALRGNESLTSSNTHLRYEVQT